MRISVVMLILRKTTHHVVRESDFASTKVLLLIASGIPMITTMTLSMIYDEASTRVVCSNHSDYCDNDDSNEESDCVETFPRNMRYDDET